MSNIDRSGTFMVLVAILGFVLLFGWQVVTGLDAMNHFIRNVFLGALVMELLFVVGAFVSERSS